MTLFNSLENQQLREENEQLKKEVQSARDLRDYYRGEVARCEKEISRQNTEIAEAKKFESRVAQLEDQIFKLRRRCAGLEQALSKRQKKANKQPAEPGPVLVFADKKTKMGGRDVYTETWTIPVPADPHLAREAWTWAENQPFFINLHRIYYHEKHGWLATVETEF